MVVTGSKLEQGVMLLEALIGILIFSIGILSMVAMQAIAISTISDAKYRSDASFLANQIITQVWLDRGANMANMSGYAYPGGTATELSNWITKLNNTLPQTTGANAPAITVTLTGTPPASGTVDVTIKWQPPNSGTVHSYRAISVVANP
jgi:type IV pilus assembly protein PilV